MVILPYHNINLFSVPLKIILWYITVLTGGLRYNKATCLKAPAARVNPPHAYAKANNLRRRTLERSCKTNFPPLHYQSAFGNCILSCGNVKVQPIFEGKGWSVFFGIETRLRSKVCHWLLSCLVLLLYAIVDSLFLLSFIKMSHVFYSLRQIHENRNMVLPVSKNHPQFRTY